MRAAGRILLGAGVGLGVAFSVCLAFIIASEYALAQGWVGRYDDLTLAMVMQALLVGGPIVGGWKAWTTRRS